MQAVRKGTFRQDLYYRLCDVSIVMPRLSDRADDIPILASHFLDEFKASNRELLNAFDVGLSESVVAFLQKQKWPGNVRQLFSAIKYGIFRCRLRHGAELEVDDFSSPEFDSPGIIGAEEVVIELGSRITLSDLKQRHTVAVLSRLHGNIFQSARVLGVTRSTLLRAIKIWGFEPDDFRPEKQ
jgi:DNA-binding NtrC family response regulator